MTVPDAGAVAIVGEVADALAAHPRMPCAPTIVEEDGLWTLSVTFRPASVTEALEVLELATALRRVQDVAQIRGFADRYQVDAAALEALIMPPRTWAEIEVRD